MEPTRVTLLRRMGQPGADGAWEEFYRLYGPVVLRYVTKSGLDEACAEDVLQETMVTLLRVMPDFQYDKRRGLFRNFLLTIVHRRIKHAKKLAHFRKEMPMGMRHLEKLHSDLTDPNFIPPDEAMDVKWLESLAEEAWRRVVLGLTASDKSAAIYDAYVRKGRPAAEVALEFGVDANVVYQIKSRIERFIGKEFRWLKRRLELTGGHEIPPAK